MALHRDIYWLGRQWAVTGYGLQAIDQRLKGLFDVEASRLWQDGALDTVRALAWVNATDFDKAIAAARKRYPEPPRQVVAAVEAMPASAEPISPGPATVAPRLLQLRAEGELAKFGLQWRIR